VLFGAGWFMLPNLEAPEARAGKRYFSQREMNHDWNGSSEVEKRGQPDVDQDEHRGTADRNIAVESAECCKQEQCEPNR
jgi:hypothetical protein